MAIKRMGEFCLYSSSSLTFPWLYTAAYKSRSFTTSCTILDDLSTNISLSTIFFSLKIFRASNTLESPVPLLGSFNSTLAPAT